jgi:hypothetical protein
VITSDSYEWIYRFGANPGVRGGGVLPPVLVRDRGSGLGSRLRVVLSPILSLGDLSLTLCAVRKTPDLADRVHRNLRIVIYRLAMGKPKGP